MLGNDGLAIRDYARTANGGSLTLDDLRRGNFTVTTGGVFGSSGDSSKYGPDEPSDSTEMPEKVGPYDAERVLRDIPRQLGWRRREGQRRDTRLGLLGVEATRRPLRAAVRVCAIRNPPDRRPGCVVPHGGRARRRKWLTPSSSLLPFPSRPRLETGRAVIAS